MSEPITREEILLNSIANSENSNLSPITREEQYLSYIAGETNTYPINPITRKEFYLDKIAKSDISGGGIGINVQPLTIKENGTYYAPQGIAYSPIIVDVQVGNGDTSVLEGDGAEFYTLAPTALSFRSTAPLNEFQEVQINGVTVDPSNYTLEEGSTIVTFPIDYLKTLNTGNYEVAVVSESKTVKGGFSVKAPELNEYGFYYNQPYTAYVDYFGATTAFFIREDGTLDVIIGDDIVFCPYAIDGNSMTVTTEDMGDLHCTISSDGTEVYCEELTTAFALSDDESIAADEDYIYIYKEDLGGYEVTAIDKKKAEYGAIKTGINGIDTVKLADGAFANNINLVNAPNIPNRVTSIGDYAFDNCISLEGVALPEHLTDIGAGAFRRCSSLAKIALVHGVTRINFEAFYDCTSLLNVLLSNNITSISSSAFGKCRALKLISYSGTVAQWRAISKPDDWIYEVPATYVLCSDGQVAL